MKTSLTFALMTLVMALGMPSFVHAEDAAPPAEEAVGEEAPKVKKKASKKSLVDITLEGKLTMTEKGEGDKKKVRFILTDAEGVNYGLRPPKAKKAKKKKKGKDNAVEGDADQPAEAAPEKPAIDLNSFVGRDIKVTARGYITEKGGKKRTTVREILAIEPL